MMGEHLDRMDIGIAVDHAARDLRPRVRGGGRGGTGAPHGPAQEPEVEGDPEEKRHDKAQVRPRQKCDGADQRRDGKGHGVEDLKQRVPGGGGCLHDPVGDAAGKVILEPADGLAQDMAVRAPADQGAEIRQDGVVQKCHVDAADDRAQAKDGDGGEQELCPVVAHDLGRAAPSQKIDQPPDIPDHPDLDHGDDHLEDPGHDKDPPERAGIVDQERQQPPGRRVRFLIFDIGIDQVLEEPEHDWPRRVAARI